MSDFSHFVTVFSAEDARPVLERVTHLPSGLFVKPGCHDAPAVRARCESELLACVAANCS